MFTAVKASSTISASALTYGSASTRSLRPWRGGTQPGRWVRSVRASRPMTTASAATAAISATSTRMSCGVPIAFTMTPASRPTTTDASSRAAPMVPNRRRALRASCRSLASVQNWTMNRLATISVQT